MVKKDKWAILCGTGNEIDYLTDVTIVDATEEEIFHNSPTGTEGGLVDDICGNIRNSFPIKLNSDTKRKLKVLVEELNKIK